MRNSKPNYRIGNYSASSKDRNILSGLFLRKNKEDISEKTFSWLFDCSCDDNSDSSSSTEEYKCDCNVECQDHCGGHVECKHCRCVDYCKCDNHCSYDSECNCILDCQCNSDCRVDERGCNCDSNFENSEYTSY